MDRLYRGLLASARFFSRGWGPVETYERMLKINPHVVDREQCASLLADHLHPVSLKMTQQLPEGAIYDGRFLSPLTTLLPGLLPKESEVVRFEMLIPRPKRNTAQPMYIQMAGTGDHYFWRRRRLIALPLLKEAGIGSVLLENPYYGSRKPRDQFRSQLHYVSDLFVMGLALILESMSLLHWLEGRGLGPVGLTGISMGGHNSSLSASLWPKPVAVVPCLSWSTASCVFTEALSPEEIRPGKEATEGVLSRAVAWDVLEEQLFYSRIGRDEGRKRVFQQILENKDNRTSLQGEYLSEPDPGLSYSVFYNAPDSDSSVETNRQTQVKSFAYVKKKKKKKFSPHHNTVSMMRSILDEATHLGTFPAPLAPDLGIFLAAKDDLYIPRQNVTDVRSLWPGCEVRYIEGGHVSSTILQTAKFRHALVDAMEKASETTTTSTTFQSC